MREATSALRGLITELPSGVIRATAHDPAQPYVSSNLGVVLRNMARSPSSDELDGVEAEQLSISSTHRTFALLEAIVAQLHAGK